MRKTLASLAVLCAFVIAAIGVVGIIPPAQSANKAVQENLAATVADLDEDVAVSAQGASAEATSGTDSSASEGQIVTASDGTQYAKNELLLVVEDASNLGDISSALEAQGAHDVTFSLVMDGLEDGASIIAASYTGDADAAYVGLQLEGSAGISAAEPNYLSHLSEVEDTAEPAAVSTDGSTADAIDLAAEAALSSTAINDPDASQQWALTSVKAYDAWDLARASGGVTVAVIDSGVDYDHPDLADNLILGDYAKDTYTEKTGSSAVDDEIGHGTHVAGIIAATTNNAVGVSGVSYNARVLPIKATCNTKGELYTRDIIEGIEYVLSLKADESSPDYLKNIRVINLSLGEDRYNALSEAAVNKAVNAGVLVVAAAGNDGRNGLDYPARLDCTVGVSALKEASDGSAGVFDSRYSNYGTGVDIAAPGTAIYSTYRNGKYESLNGTSMATPVVSGAAALLFATHMDATPDQVRTALQASAVDLGDSGRDDYYGYGALDMKAAIYKLEQTYVHTHVAGEATRENEVAATHSQEGSYDLVVRCTVCNEVMSSEHYTVPMLTYAITRLAGDNAFGTMTSIVRAGWADGSCDKVILATFDGYWDALAAAGLAGEYDCPVLLTDAGGLSSAARDEIVRLGAKTVVIAGGTAAVSDTVADQVRQLGCAVERYAGDTAIGTSLAIYDAGATAGSWGSTCIVATVNGYYDALSASSYAYAQGAPIFLANEDGSVSSQVVEAIKAGGFTRVVIAGGTACVTDAAANALGAATGATIDRRAGANCFETSVALANLCLEDDMTAEGMGFATGLGGYWDALSSAAFLGKNQAPLLLVDDGYTQAIKFTTENAASISSVYVFGGTSAVSDLICDAISRAVLSN